MLERRQYVFLAVVGGALLLGAGGVVWYLAAPPRPQASALDQLFLCIQRNDVQGVRRLVDARTAKVHAPRTGETALHAAARAGNGEMVAILLAAGADRNAKDNLRGSTPLHNAVAADSSDVIELLLAAGADPNVRDAARGFTPLHDAVDLVRLRAVETAIGETLQRAPSSALPAATPPAASSRPAGKTPLAVIRVLLGHKADPNATGHSARTPLHLAALIKGPAARDLIKLLLDAGADPNRPDAHKATPLHLAAETDAPAVEALLAGKANPNAVDAAGRTPLQVAARADLPPCVTLLLRAGADASGSLPLQEALAAGGVKVAELLIDNGADIAAPDASGVTIAKRALGGDRDYAVFKLWARVLLPKPGWNRAGNLLHRDPAVAALRGPGGLTLLHKAAEEVVVPVAQALLAAKADPNARTAEGLCPLHYAVGFTPRPISESEPRGPLDPETLGRQKDFINLLCDQGADVNAADKDGLPPLAVAARAGRGDLIDLLLTRKADPKLSDKHGATAMTHAAFFGHVEIIRKLAAAGVPLDMFAATALGDVKTIAQLAAADPKAVRARAGVEMNSPLHVAGLMEDPAVATALLAAGADIDARDARKRTPLHVAAGLSLPYVQELIKRGANVKALDAAGRTPLHCLGATASGPVVQLLVDSGADVNAKDAAGRTPLLDTPLYRTQIRQLLKSLGAKE